MKLRTIISILSFIIFISVIKINGERSIPRKLTILKNHIHFFLLPSTDSKVHKRLLKQKSRFIAHAGGAIEGFSYTNSLEALNQSYKNGLRYFELDLNTTRDNKIVATHDWSNWKKNTSYQGPIPPVLKDFMSYKLHQKFTPLDAKLITNWFTEHPDTYLVTDKINNPRTMLKIFPTFSKRIYMELFSWDAIKQANALPLGGVLATGNLFTEKNDYLQYIEKFNVKYVALSRKRIPHHLEKLIEMKKRGIKVYLFHTNQDGFTDSKTFKKMVPLAYGLYIDQLPSLK